VKSIIIAMAIFASTQASAHYLGRYINQLRSNCENLKTLAVKKSVIALSKDTEHKCHDTYSKIVIKECKNKVTCADLYSWLEEAKNSYSGNVIGN
jgi:hypothetical protein